MKTSALLLVMTAGLLVAADTEDVKKEKDKLKGTWSLISLQVPQGEKGPSDKEIEQMKMVFTDDTVTIKFGDKEKPAKYTLDPAKNPKEINIMPKDKDNVVKGIYALDGDTLKICAAEKGDRPKEFKPDAASQAAVLTLKRDKK